MYNHFPSCNTLHHRLPETIRYLAQQYELRRNRVVATKTYLRLPEITQLIDEDIRATPCIEYAEYHHLAWILGRICALRPGSLGEPSQKDQSKAPQHLVFRDVKVTRGEYTAAITIRNLKSSEVGLSEQGRPASCEIDYFPIISPQDQHNLFFSFPRRLLVVALRRNAIQGITSIEDLLDGNNQNVLFKEEFVD
ncbi:hypothetical protein GGR57DRAFT_437290 [Xylariaceae sp. FL1272]|nr:hypothetical protein GGR57DRAFT_437290 [Xylariaceae sp. FL1272]